MKKISQILFAGFLLLILISSCKKDSSGKSGSKTPPENVQDITATPGYGFVTIAWAYPNDSSYSYVNISYIDTTGKTTNIQYSKYTDTAVITGLLNKSYTFTITAVDIAGGISTSQATTVTPNAPLYSIVQPTLNIVSDSGGVDVKWQNTTGQQVQIQITYLDVNNATQTVSDTSSRAADSLFIWGLPKATTTFSVVVGAKTGGPGVLAFYQGPPVQLTGSPLQINLNSFAGIFNVVNDPWYDFIQNGETSVLITVVNDSTFTYPSPVPDSNGVHQPLLFHVNPYSLQITSNVANYGSYGTGNTVTMTTAGGYSQNHVWPKDYSVYLNLDYVVEGSGDQGAYPLVLQKQ